MRCRKLAWFVVLLIGFVPASRPCSSVYAISQEKAPSEKKAEDGDKKEKKDGEKKDEEKQPSSVKRPTKPEKEPDPSELDIRPDADGLIKFSFHGQPWPRVLQWLADASPSIASLDWQELPPDYLNLVSEESYSIDEAKDLFNRLLLDRGYTMVLKRRILSVFKIDKLEPSLLPRIDDESLLHDLPAYDFVKITFNLPDELKADKAAEDIKPLLSPHAKIQPLLSTNRLLVIGAVANLRHVSRILNAEHAAAKEHTVPREFPIRHVRADYVADQVMILLGLDPASRRSPQELQLEQSRLQLFTQMNQKGKDITKYLKKADHPVHIAVNVRRNSVLVNAPPAEMKIIERSIKNLDIGDGDNETQAVTRVGASKPTHEKYKLISLDPNSIVNALYQIGDLEPRTQLNVDAKSRTIFAYATESDHEKIRSMIEGLDGTGRKFEVIWLRNLPADRIAATIHDLMVGAEDKQTSGRRYYYYYRDDEKEDENNKFRVDADVERNRLLLWVTDTELEQIKEFLIKMGEIPGGESNPNTVRLLDPRDPEDTLRILQQIRDAWPSIGPNELRIQGTEPTDKPEEKPQDLEKDNNKADEGNDNPTEETRVVRIEDPRLRTKLVQLFPDAVKNSGPAPTATQHVATKGSPPTSEQSQQSELNSSLAPVTVSVSEDGRIMISSKDTKALDRLEDLLKQVAPPAKDFEIFYLKYAFASLVVANLEEFFENKADFNTEENWWRAYYGMSFESSKSGGKGLGSKRELKFIYDLDTNSILVSNASPEQLATVRRLIEIYDKPPSEENISARKFRIFKLKHARVEQVAATLKEVYRDLLSSKDKEFANNQKDEEKQSQNSGYVRIYGGFGSSNNNDDKKPTKVRQSFAGALSIGIDKVSNTLILSAQEEWIESISLMVQHLDSATEEHKNSVAYGQMAGNLRGMNLQSALNTMLLKQSQNKGDKNDEKPAGEQPNGQPGNGQPAPNQQ